MAPNNILRLYASYYFGLGFNVSCITNSPHGEVYTRGPFKAPSHEWKYLIGERQCFEVLNRYDWDSAIGLGAILGYNDYRALDIDGCPDEEFIDEVLEILDLPLDYEWVVRSGSHQGLHVYFSSQDYDFSAVDGRLRAFLPNPDYRGCFRRIEFRWQDHLVLPPSLHASSNRYEFTNVSLPLNPPAPVQAKNLYQLLGRAAARAFSRQSFPSVEDEDVEKTGIDEECDDWRAMQEEDWEFDELLKDPPMFAIATISEDYLNPYLDIEFPDSLPDSVQRIDSGYVRPFYLFFDTETTGLPKRSQSNSNEVENWPRLVQMAWLQLDQQGREICAESHIIRPDGFTIPAEASRIHHITTERAIREGEELDDILIDFERLVRDSDFLVAHNMSFDEGVISAEFERSGLATVLPTRQKICTMVHSTEFCGLAGPYGPKWPRLSELYAKLFQTQLEESHDALVDVRATARCFWELADRGVRTKPMKPQLPGRNYNETFLIQ